MEIALILLVVAGAGMYLAKRFKRSLSGSCGCSCADCPGSKTPSPCQGCAELKHLQEPQTANSTQPCTERSCSSQTGPRSTGSTGSDGNSAGDKHRS